MPDTASAADRIRQMQEEELMAFIRETVIVLNNTVDRLETFARDRNIPEPSFETQTARPTYDQHSDKT